MNVASHGYFFKLGKESYSIRFDGVSVGVNMVYVTRSSTGLATFLAKALVQVSC